MEDVKPPAEWESSNGTRCEPVGQGPGTYDLHLKICILQQYRITQILEVPYPRAIGL